MIVAETVIAIWASTVIAITMMVPLAKTVSAVREGIWFRT